MADNNNALVGKLPKKPNPELRKLDGLIGNWKQYGDAEGTAEYEWMEGGFFLIQRFYFRMGDRRFKGVEYIGFDEDTKTLRSHLMDNCGQNLTYTREIKGDTLTIWFGDKGSDNYYQGKFSKDGNALLGRWQWPEGGGKIGGFELNAKRTVGNKTIKKKINILEPKKNS
jgi:hypothetical protein